MAEAHRPVIVEVFGYPPQVYPLASAPKSKDEYVRKAMFKNCLRRSPEYEFLSKKSITLKLPTLTTRRLLSTVVPSCIGSESSCMRSRQIRTFA